MSELERKIQNSNSYKSLVAEREIYKLFEKIDWITSHSFYFQDPTTKKPRELDIYGQRTWAVELPNQNFTTVLHIPIELKSSRDYHLLFSPDTVFYSTIEANSKILSESSQFYNSLAENVRSNHSIEISNSTVSGIRKFIKDPEFKNQLDNVTIKPHPAQYSSTSFRETNIGNEKELENSVFWKASQSLNTAIESIKEDEFNQIMKSTLYGLPELQDSQISPDVSLLTYLIRNIGRVSLFHPVLIIDAKLWAIDRGELKGIDWVRFIRSMPFRGENNYWFDVVNSSAFPAYFNTLVEHYSSAFSEIGAKEYII